MDFCQIEFPCTPFRGSGVGFTVWPAAVMTTLQAAAATMIEGLNLRIVLTSASDQGCPRALTPPRGRSDGAYQRAAGVGVQM